MKTYARHTPWVVPPECQGQTVEYAYALGFAEVILERVTDQSIPSGPYASRITYIAYAYPQDDDGSWEPQNGAPTLGMVLGECHVNDDEDEDEDEDADTELTENQKEDL